MAAAAQQCIIPEDLIHDILVRLPAAAVLRFRAVCKQWRALVDDPSFTWANHKRCLPMPLLCLRRDDLPEQEPRHFRVRLEAIDLRACSTRPVIRFTAPARRDHRTRVRRPGGLLGSEPGPLVRDEGGFQVHGSCDGVLLVSYKAGLYLCNPARRRWTKVPALNFDDIVGLYDAHRPSGDFRVLLLHRSSRRGTVNVDYDYRILTLSPSPVTSRKITGGPHSDQLLAAIRIRPASESPPALVAGNLHWLPHPHTSTSSEDLLVFDTVAETFRRMRPPPAAAEAQALLELDGKLTMTLTHGDLASAELWVLQDYERQDSWACELRIPLPPAADIVRDRPGAVAIVSPGGDVMVQCADCLLQCDAKGRVRIRHQPAEHHRIVAVPHMFRESLVAHGCVNGQEITTGYGAFRILPFFLDCNCSIQSVA